MGVGRSVRVCEGCGGVWGLCGVCVWGGASVGGVRGCVGGAGYGGSKEGAVLEIFIDKWLVHGVH